MLLTIGLLIFLTGCSALLPVLEQVESLVHEIEATDAMFSVDIEVKA